MQNQEQLLQKVVMLVKKTGNQAIKKPVYETAMCKEKANTST